jgi:hypothetical protein
MEIYWTMGAAGVPHSMSAMLTDRRTSYRDRSAGERRLCEIIELRGSRRLFEPPKLSCCSRGLDRLGFSGVANEGPSADP